ncbi:MAG: hypothetical protein SGARI_006868, partial [Bacillariaceae sp.]
PINQYFQTIVDLIHEHGGDVIKFAGDALIVEWKEQDTHRGGKSLRKKQPKDASASWKAVLDAATCAARIVDKCSDFPVYYNKNKNGNDAIPKGSIHSSDSEELISTLNVHVGLAYGHVMSCSVGDSSRREYLILGEAIQQVADAMAHAKKGEVVASPEAYAILNDAAWIVNPMVFEDDGSRPQIIANKLDQYFKPRNMRGSGGDTNS